MGSGWPFSLLNEKHLNNKVRVEHQPENQSIDFFSKEKLRRTCAARTPEILVCRMPSSGPPMSGWFSTVERRSKKPRMWLSPWGGLSGIWKTSELCTPKWWFVWWLLDMFFWYFFRGSFQHFKFTLKTQMIQLWLIIFQLNWFNLVQPLHWMVYFASRNIWFESQEKIFSSPSSVASHCPANLDPFVCEGTFKNPACSQRYSRYRKRNVTGWKNPPWMKIFQYVMLVFRGLVMGYCTTIVYYRSKFFHLENGNRRVAKNLWEVVFFLLQWTLRL